MNLDMPTVSAVSIAVTAMLGLVLVFDWWRERTSLLVGWWGIAQLVASVGIIIAVIAAAANSADLHAFGQAWMVLSGAIIWMATRQFEGRTFHPLWIGAAPLAFLAVQLTGMLESFDARLILACAMLSVLHFAAASELSRDGSEWLPSRWLAIILLAVTGIGYLTWLPLTLTMPIHEANLVFMSRWFPAVVLITMLGRIALAFTVLALVKERGELKQRINALTDPLTGLPNRRALFAAANELGEQSAHLKGDPVSVLVFDLDHFKKINDTFGHRFGDRVLQLFARTLAEKLETGSIVGRLGGEEFAAILPGADMETAMVTAESIRATFEASAEVIDGTQVASTVSIGGAAHDDIDCDLGTLFHRADGALYAAKSSGRNRVEFQAASATSDVFDAYPVALASLAHQECLELHKSWGSMRRYRRPVARSA
jgi:diguanylate cyclase (GGDEF)-like protein